MMTDKKYNVAIFDLDGTLLDTSEGILSSVEYTIQEYGLRPLDKETMLRFIGPPIQDSFRRVYSLEGAPLQELATIFRNRYKESDLLKAKPYPQMDKVFEYLTENGVKSAVATYKRQDYAEKIVKHFGFDQYIKTIHGADHDNKLKKSDIINNCLTDLGVSDLGRAVMIGDSLLDAEGAEINGISFIGVTYGFDFKSGKDVVACRSVGHADAPIELIEYFKMEKEI